MKKIDRMWFSDEDERVFLVSAIGIHNVPVVEVTEDDLHNYTVLQGVQAAESLMAMGILNEKGLAVGRRVLEALGNRL